MVIGQVRQLDACKPTQPDIWQQGELVVWFTGELSTQPYQPDWRRGSFIAVVSCITAAGLFALRRYRAMI
jgi:hypothetical protein